MCLQFERRMCTIGRRDDNNNKTVSLFCREGIYFQIKYDLKKPEQSRSFENGLIAKMS